MIPCASLRSKSVYGAGHTSADEWRRHHAEHRSQGTCLRTGHAWGPDGHAVSPEECHPGRPCYRPDPLVTPPEAWDRVTGFFGRLFRR